MHSAIKTLTMQHRFEHDPDDHLLDAARWSPLLANKLAEADGLQLEEDHWQVIFCLREMYRVLGPDWTARQITRQLEKDFISAGGRRFLYQLFPRGPLTQGCRLAGLPLPHGTLNLSFGSVH